jgi:hypothetical protein
MPYVSQAQYKSEVDSYVWDFLVKVVAFGLIIMDVFTMMSDELLGVTQGHKWQILEPQLYGSGAIFLLQVSLMLGIHTTSPKNYVGKRTVIAIVACMQFLCLLFNFMIFTGLLQQDFDVLRQIDIFYWLLTFGYAGWGLYWFICFMARILFPDPPKFVDHY